MGVDLLIFILLGGMSGMGMYGLSQWLILRRTGQRAQNLILGNRWSWIVWMLAGSLGCGVIIILTDGLEKSMEYMAVYLILISLSAVDGSIRKIPNELLLALMILKVGIVLAHGDFSKLLPACLGLIIGVILFLIPSHLSISIGIGDVKLAAVAGFFLGITGLFQAVLIMAAVLGLYGLFLIVTKRGSFKSKVAIGPSLSLGILAALLFPIAIAI